MKAKLFEGIQAASGERASRFTEHVPSQFLQTYVVNIWEIYRIIK